MDSFKATLAKLLKARFPYIYVATPEETRVADIVSALSKDESLIKTPRTVYTWTATKGIQRDGRPASRSDTKQPLGALEMIETNEEAAIFLLLDFHVYFGFGGRVADFQIIRKLRDIIGKIKNNPNPQNVIFVSPVLMLPVELQKDVTILEFDLPGPEELRDLLNEMIEANQQSGRIHIELTADDEQLLVNAALGLTLHEAENAFARAMVDNGRLDAEDVAIVLEEKCQIIRKSEILEYVRTDTTMKDVGGLANLKRWLEKRDRAWLDEAKDYCLPAPKGILITGVPGCGKSLTAKATSALWQLPLLRLDVGKVFSGIVGSSEENVRKALRTAEAVAPSILWIDEIEKGFGSASSTIDGGTTSRVFGTFLTWMQEKCKPVFVLATANNISRLPPEFLRKGRFDEIFFVDLPTNSERQAILQVHLGKRLRNQKAIKDFRLDGPALSRLVDMTEGFTGAEIEQAIVSALFDAFADRRSLTMDDLFKAIRNTVPLSVTMAEEIIALREWADVRAVAATPAEERSEYSVATGAETEADPEASEETQKNIHGTRGGRAIDF